ncbi:MAG: hypothetical protein U0S12_11925 [Fimbriimonadales bacterium]
MNKPWSLLAPVWQPHPGKSNFLESDAKIKVWRATKWGKTDACAAQIVLDLLRPRPRATWCSPPPRTRRGSSSTACWRCWRLGEIPKLRRSSYPRLTLETHRLTARSDVCGC